MRLLLDTSALILWLEDSPRLARRARAEIIDRQNQIYVSAVSAWEIAIKLSLGKLNVPRDAAMWLPGQLAADRFTPLPVEMHHALAVEGLPMHHRDPFDRLLISQAIVEGLTIVTGDRKFGQYDLTVLWN